jgi:hypothetical protein
MSIHRQSIEKIIAIVAVLSGCSVILRSVIIMYPYLIHIQRFEIGLVIGVDNYVFNEILMSGKGYLDLERSG